MKNEKKKSALQEYLEEMNEKFVEASKQLSDEQNAHGVVKEINGSLSLRVGYDWKPLKQERKKEHALN